jgi:2Fe-2S ferredoxin
MTTDVSMIRVHVTDRQGAGSQQEFQTGQSLMQALRGKGYPIQAIWGKLAPREDFETMLVEDTNAFDEAASRLSCQIELAPELDGLAITIAPED